MQTVAVRLFRMPFPTAVPGTAPGGRTGRGLAERLLGWIFSDDRPEDWERSGWWSEETMD